MNIFLLGATPSIATDPGEDSMSKLAKTGGNTGNQLIARGLLDRLEYEDVSWDYRIDPAAVRERFDAIVIPAANFLFPSFDLGGMADYIERSDLPVAIVGLGAQSNNYDPNIALLPGTERFVKVIAERAVCIGVRGPYTQEVLARRGVQNVTVTGCPSYYMGGSEGVNLAKKPIAEIKRISINASRDVIGHSFDKDRMLRLVRGIYRAGVAWDADFIAQSEHAEIKIADQGASASDGSLKEMAAFLQGIVPENEARCWAAKHVQVFFEVNDWFRAIQRYDFVFGNRFHGCMVALQRQVPAIVICHDTRTEDMCRFLAIPSVSIMELEEIAVEELYDRVDCDALNSRYRVLYSHYEPFLKMNNLIVKQ